MHTRVHTCTHTLIHVHIRTHLHESFWRQNRRILNSELIWTTLAAWGFRLDPKHLPPPKKRKYSLLTINLVNRRKHAIEMCLVRPTHNSKTREAEAGDWGQPGLQNNPLTHSDPCNPSTFKANFHYRAISNYLKTDLKFFFSFKSAKWLNASLQAWHPECSGHGRRKPSCPLTSRHEQWHTHSQKD